jgi:hypothetical protein
MATKKSAYITQKVDPIFINKVRETALKRIQRGVDRSVGKEQASIRRFTKAMSKYQPLWEVLETAKITDE